MSFILGTTIVRTPLAESVCRTPFVQTSTVQTVVPSDITTFATVRAYCHEITSNHIHPIATNILYDLSDFTYEFWNCQSGCDKYDYAMAAFSGVATGLIDSFFVRSPLYSPLGQITDAAVDKVVINFAQWVYKLDKKNNVTHRKGSPHNIASAIGFLEERYRVNYDARYGKDLLGGETLANFYPGNHHLKSLAHCPDIVGLFFSVLDQLTGKTSIANHGSVVRLSSIVPQTSSAETDFVAKVICGIKNWFGHIMSDVAGSSGTRGHVGKRGSGIPIPGFELFQFAGINPKAEISALSHFTDLMFQNGYDFRFGITMSIPVMINQALTTLFWGMRQRLCYHRTWKDILLSMKRDRQLARMQLVSTGCFTLIDVGDAALRSHGQLMLFALHLNYVGMCKFAFAGYRELTLRCKHAWSAVQMEKEWNTLVF